MKFGILVVRVALNSLLNVLGFLGLFSIFLLIFLLPKFLGMDGDGDIFATEPNLILLMLYVISIICTIRIALFGYFSVSDPILRYWDSPEDSSSDGDIK